MHVSKSSVVLLTSLLLTSNLLSSKWSTCVIVPISSTEDLGSILNKETLLHLRKGGLFKLTRWLIFRNKQIKVPFLSQAWRFASCLFNVFPQLIVLVPLGTEFFNLLVLSLHFFGNHSSFLFFLPVVPCGDECSLFKKRCSIVGQCGTTCLETCEHRPVVVMDFVLSCNRTVFLSGLLPHPHSMSDHEPVFTAAWSGTRPACLGGPKFASLIHIKVLENVDTSTNKPNFLSKPPVMMKHNRCECRHQLQVLFFSCFFFVLCKSATDSVILLTAAGDERFPPN